MRGVPWGPTWSVHRGDHGPSIELRNGSNSEVPISFAWREGNIVSWQMARMRRTSRSRRPCARGDILCAEPGRSHPCPDLFAGPAREGVSRTPSMHVDEKSDGATVPRKRPNKGRQLPAEVVEGRASRKGNSWQTAVARTLSRIATSIRLAAVRWIAASPNR